MGGLVLCLLFGTQRPVVVFKMADHYLMLVIHLIIGRLNRISYLYTLCNLIIMVMFPIILVLVEHRVIQYDVPKNNYCYALCISAAVQRCAAVFLWGAFEIPRSIPSGLLAENVHWTFSKTLTKQRYDWVIKSRNDEMIKSRNDRKKRSRT